MHKEITPLKRNAYEEIHSGNPLNVFICLTTALTTDGSHWCIIFTKFLDPKSVLPHIYQILRHMNKTPPRAQLDLLQSKLFSTNMSKNCMSSEWKKSLGFCLWSYLFITDFICRHKYLCVNAHSHVPTYHFTYLWSPSPPAKPDFYLTLYAKHTNFVMVL